MTKHYCDRCDIEMKKSDHNRLHGSDATNRFQYEIMTTVDGVTNGGHLCHKCIREMVIACTAYRASKEDQ